MGFFTDALKFAEECEKAPLRIAIAQIEASKFIGEDGKEYIRFPKPRGSYPIREKINGK